MKDDLQVVKLRNLLLPSVIWLCLLLPACVFQAKSNPTQIPPTVGVSRLPYIYIKAPPLAGFYVAPDGTPDGDGSWEKPWDLVSALGQPDAVRPGDTIWLRGGTYTGSFVSYLLGTEDAAITVRQYPGERATINGNLSVQHGWTTYWGFEMMNTDQTQYRINGLMTFAEHTKFINLIVHDNRGSGIGIWKESPDSEIYGCLIYNNGTDKFDHGIYAQSRVGTQHILDNVLFNNSGHGIHGYSGQGQYIIGLDIQGNTSFNNGWSSPYASNILVGGDTPAERITLLENNTYYPNNDRLNVDLGYWTTANKDVMIKENYFVGGSPVFSFREWSQVDLTNNTLYGTDNLVSFPLPEGLDISSYQWDNNTYFDAETSAPFSFHDQNLNFAEWQQATNLDHHSQYTSGRPIGAKVFVRPNKYEPGRANIIVYNWGLTDTVDVDVSNVLKIGAPYEVWNAQDYFGKPVANGTYDGTPLHLPMTGLPPASPNGGWVPKPSATGPEFNVFVLTSR